MFEVLQKSLVMIRNCNNLQDLAGNIKTEPEVHVDSESICVSESKQFPYKTSPVKCEPEVSNVAQ